MPRIVNIGTTSLSSAQSLYQLAKGHICFVVAIVIWIIVYVAFLRSQQLYH